MFSHKFLEFLDNQVSGAGIKVNGFSIEPPLTWVMYPIETLLDKKRLWLESCISVNIDNSQQKNNFDPWVSLQFDTQEQMTKVWINFSSPIVTLLSVTLIREINIVVTEKHHFDKSVYTVQWQLSWKFGPPWVWCRE